MCACGTNPTSIWGWRDIRNPCMTRAPAYEPHLAVKNADVRSGTAANSREGPACQLGRSRQCLKGERERKTHKHHISPLGFTSEKQSSKRVINQPKICTDVGSRGGHGPFLISLKLTAALLTCTSPAWVWSAEHEEKTFQKAKNKKEWVDFRAASFSQSQSLNEMLPSFSFSCRVSCASFSSSSWTFPVKIIVFGLFSQIKRQNWTPPPTNSSFICAITHKRNLYAPLLFPILHYFSFLSWHQPTGVKMLKSEHRRGKLRHIRFETVKA